jgi:hypothetical protein
MTIKISKMIKTTAAVVEVEKGAVRLRVGATGHQHRILFPIPTGQEEPFRRALVTGAEVNVWIEVPVSA